MSRAHVNLPILVAGIFIVVFGLFFLSHAPTESLQKEEKLWRDRIAQVGADEAYKEFAESVRNLSSNEQHTKAHYFGGALYKEEGIPGLPVCDVRFSQGCFHEFLGEAISSHGLQVFPQLANKCANEIAPNSFYCQHGLGHGLVALFGYDEQAIKKALAECDRIVESDVLNGCYTGVFMEYNLQLVSHGGVNAPRNMTQENALSPCYDLAGIAQWICFFARAQWWQKAMVQNGMTSEQSMLETAQMCAKIREEWWRDVCFRGLGHIVAFETNFDVLASKAFCDQLSENARYRLFCRAETASNILMIENAPEKALSMCADLRGESLSFCNIYGSNINLRKSTIHEPSL